MLSSVFSRAGSAGPLGFVDLATTIRRALRSTPSLRTARRQSWTPGG
jgi:hypothetical protein